MGPKKLSATNKMVMAACGGAEMWFNPMSEEHAELPEARVFTKYNLLTLRIPVTYPMLVSISHIPVCTLV